MIGYGAWGRHHARAIASVDGASPRRDRRSIRRKVGARRGRTIRRPTSTPTTARCSRAKQLDLCDVVLPSDLHFAVARDVLESGRHLLLEKPMALTLEHCDDAGSSWRSGAAASSRSGTSCGMSSLWGKVKELVDAGAIGEPLYAMIELWRRPYRLGSGGWRYDAGRVGELDPGRADPFLRPRAVVLRRRRRAGIGLRGGQRQAAGPAGAARQLLGDRQLPRRAVRGHLADAGRVGTPPDREDHRHRRGDLGVVERRDGPHVRADLLAEAPARRRAVEAVADPEASGEVYELVDQVAAVVRAVRGEGTPVPCTGEDGRWSTAMCLKAAESIRTGRPVGF